MAPSSRRIVLLLLLFLQTSIPIDALAQQPSAGSPRVIAPHPKRSSAVGANAKSAADPRPTAGFRKWSQSLDRPIGAAQAYITGQTALSWYNQSVESVSPRKATGPYQFVEAGPALSQTILNLPLIRGYQIGREGAREARADDTWDRGCRRRRPIPANTSCTGNSWRRGHSSRAGLPMCWSSELRGDFTAANRSTPTWGWFLVKTPVVASNGWGRSASKAIPCCNSCWWRPRRRRHA